MVDRRLERARTPEPLPLRVRPLVMAPQRIIASEYDPPAVFGPAPKAKRVRTRPLCPWPKVAHYKGSGSTDEAANFACE